MPGVSPQATEDGNTITMRYLSIIILLLSLFPAGVCQAATVRVELPAQADKTTDDPAAKARSEAFVGAVWQEALDVLPGSLNEIRAARLRDYLEPMAERFVMSYSLLAAKRTEKGYAAEYEVAVNRDQLVKTLKELGTYYTVNRPIPYSLTVKGPASESWTRLSELQLVSGLDAVGRADLELILDYDGERWSGTLGTGDATWRAGGEDLDTVWGRLMAEYFGRRQSSGGEVVRLEVAGWFASDGVQAFDEVLSGWNAAVAEARLVEVSLDPSSIGADWRVEALDTGLLEELMSEYAAGRGLSFTLTRL